MLWRWGCRRALQQRAWLLLSCPLLPRGEKSLSLQGRVCLPCLQKALWDLAALGS